MENELKKILAELDGSLKDKKFLLTVSGGADSVALAHLFDRFGFQFVIAHCNFNLREKDSKLDEQFVQELGKQLRVTTLIKQFDTKTEASLGNESIQMIARRLRYNWFDELKDTHKCDYIVTAHHLDDRIESFFLNLFRGTGINGMSPIPYFNDKLFRPLIDFSKKEILEYLNQNDLTFREDLSNQDSKYERNKVRLELIPSIEKEFPEFRSKFKQTFKQIEEEKTILSKIENDFLTENLVDHKDYWSIQYDSLNIDTKIHWLLQRFEGHSGQIKEIKKLIKSQSGIHIQIGSYLLYKNGNQFEIIKKTNDTIQFEINQIPFENQYIQVSESSKYPLEFRKDSLYINKDKIKLPLSVRVWNKGDRLIPLGMKGSKLVSDYLTDRKIGGVERKQTLVLLSNKEIIGVLGHTCSELIKISKENPNTLIIRLKSI